MARSLNRVQLIGNLTRDPELRYTPSGTAVCSFGLATNRSWTTDTGEKHEESEFHKIVSWNKLAELCSQFLVKGRKVYVEGRLSTRNWTTQDGQQRSTTEVVIDDMILLDSKGQGQQPVRVAEEERVEAKEPVAPKPAKETKRKSQKRDKKEEEESVSGEEISPDDIPF
jgi:single-strand DNA-binding protein